MTGLCPILNFKHVVFDTLAEAIWVARWVLIRNERQKEERNLGGPDLLIDNAFGYRSYPSHDPFTRLQLFSQMTTGLQEIVWKRH
jgi:hypothetical protein